MIPNDVYPDINPAFCSLVLTQFVASYHECSNDFPTYPLLLLPIPLILSNELDSLFLKQRKSSDFFVQLEKHPEVKVFLNQRIKDTLEITQHALAFSLQFDVLEYLDNSKKFRTTENSTLLFEKSIPSIVNTYIKKTALLGSWLGKINSDSTIYTYLGVQI